MSGLIFNFALKWAGARLREPTTYAGLFVFVGSHFGLTFAPELQGEITQALIAIAGAALIVLNGEGTITRVKGIEPIFPAPMDDLPAVPSPPGTTADDLNRAELAAIRKRRS
jgi:hypothetical protein